MRRELTGRDWIRIACMVGPGLGTEGCQSDDPVSPADPSPAVAPAAVSVGPSRSRASALGKAPGSTPVAEPS